VLRISDFLRSKEDLVAGKRYLIVTADDYGIGPATSQGILDLAARGRVTCAVLLVTSPYAEAAVRAWRRAGEPVELGWHPCLTLDRPVLPDRCVPSLVTPDGRFWPLARFLGRLFGGWIRPAEVEAELRAQWLRFGDLVGHPPLAVNAHHHVQIFAPIGDILRELLIAQRPRPYVRRVREPLGTWLRVPGARGKRGLLSLLGRREAQQLAHAGFPGNDGLAGITDPVWSADPDFLVRWLDVMPGEVVEWTCHPGHLDLTLLGRDATDAEGQLQRRVWEFALLDNPRFPAMCQRQRFTLVAPSELVQLQSQGETHAA
jgi:predicted glycoside hydrolase/deacetylase ChbG (UPF0249 family)